MNIVLQNPRTKGWYIATIRKSDIGIWGVRGKILSADGTLIETGQEAYFATLSVAEKTCKSRAKHKEKIKGMVRMTVADLPENAYRHIEPDAENWVDPEEMMQLLLDAKKERYVFFSDVTGIEEYFQTNLEYLAYTTEDEDIYQVIDKYGIKRNCMVGRFSEVENTERTEQVVKSFTEA